MKQEFEISAKKKANEKKYVLYKTSFIAVPRKLSYFA